MSTEFKDAYEIGQSAEIKTIEINGITHMLTPPNCAITSMEHLMPAPNRIECHPMFGDIPSFAEYIEEFKEDGTRIFVDEANRRFVSVFDFHSKEKGPAWGDHSASMQLEFAHEWQRFKQYDNQVLKPAVFAELLEDNLQYVNAEDLSGADLLSMAQTFKINIKGNAEVEESLHSGLKTLIIKDDSTVSARDGKGKEVKFPEKITFGLRIYKNQDHYPIEVYLRYRKKDNGLVFFIKIPDTKGAEEQALNLVIEKIRDVTQLPTLRGAFSGPSHK
ncbi:DUF2303 family protein [Teredinibacter turnerae]|uniref:DUF2303 family protein n=1 Tax=Teredinibacter turnerae TaxID=2426 RepID=UPI0030CEA91A